MKLKQIYNLYSSLYKKTVIRFFERNSYTNACLKSFATRFDNAFS